MRAGKEAASIGKRQVGCEHRTVGGDRSTSSGNGYAGWGGRDLQRPRVFVDRPAHRNDPVSEPDAVAPRMEVQLIVETDGRLDRIWQLRRGGEDDRDAKASTSVRLGFDGYHCFVALRVRHGGRGREITFDLVRPRELDDGSNGALVGVGIRTRPLVALAVDEFSIDEA